MDDMIPAPTSPFEAIRHTDEPGDYWMARELMPLLEYSTWQKFEEAIQRAMTDCAKAGRDVQENFNPKVKNPEKSAGRPGKDYRLTRYACRLIAMTAQTSGSVVEACHHLAPAKLDAGGGTALEIVRTLDTPWPNETAQLL